MAPDTGQQTANLQQSWQQGEVYDARGLDGCQFLIRTANGQQFQPINLDEAYQKDGLKIEFQAEPVEDMMSICMAGQMVRILNIKEKK